MEELVYATVFVVELHFLLGLPDFWVQEQELERAAVKG